MPTRTDPTVDRYDAIVIGAGSGGLTVAVGLATFGRSVALIEADKVGGDCTNTGCIPSKVLLHHSPDVDRSSRSPASVLETVRSKRDELRLEEEIEYSSTENIDLVLGRAELVAAGEVDVVAPNGSRRRLAGSNVVVATGSRPRRLTIPDLPEHCYLTNEELFELEHPPRHLVIVGGGPIGVEMAQAFRQLGSEVTVLEAAPQLLPTHLPRAAEMVARHLSSLGVDVRPGQVAHHFDPTTSRLAVGPLGGDATGFVEGVDKVLVAVGRIPNSEGLGLEALGVRRDGGRIVVDDKGQSSVDAVWAVGDVSTEGATTHAANAWGRRVVRHIIAPLAPANDRPLHPSVTYTTPEVASIGHQPVDPGREVRRIELDLSKTDRAFTDEVSDGLIVVDVRRFSGKVLGATIVGPRAGELISIFSLGMKAGVPFHKWYGTVWPYPSYADAIGHVVDEYMKSSMRNWKDDARAWAGSRLTRWRR